MVNWALLPKEQRLCFSSHLGLDYLGNRFILEVVLGYFKLANQQANKLITAVVFDLYF